MLNVILNGDFYVEKNQPVGQYQDREPVLSGLEWNVWQ
jgi:hypothetical protein